MPIAWENSMYGPRLVACKVCNILTNCKHDDIRGVWLCENHYAHQNLDDMLLGMLMVNHPEHYTSHPSGVECIQITEHMNFCLGNVIKYVWRADSKNGLEDLRKAQWYLNREIERRERS